MRSLHSNLDKQERRFESSRQMILARLGVGGQWCVPGRDIKAGTLGPYKAAEVRVGGGSYYVIFSAYIITIITITTTIIVIISSSIIVIVLFIVIFSSSITSSSSLSSIPLNTQIYKQTPQERHITLYHATFVPQVGGMVLHEGQVAEMGTGEGKTLVAVLAAYLNALPSR